jgi:lipopolysaccharide/colanic/teichoic acid biosynthesis glycosyltransferase
VEFQTIASGRRAAGASMTAPPHVDVRSTDHTPCVARRVKTFRPYVMGEPFFKSVLVREFRRAERSNLPAAVVLLSFASDRPTPAADWRPVVAALNAAKRETDVIGWFTPGATVAVVLPEIRGAASEVVRAFEFRVRRELANRGEALAADTLVARFHLSPVISPNLGERHRQELLPIEIRPRPQQATAYDATKRALDIVGSLALLAVLAPALLLIAALVKLTSRGPVFFRQVRIGEMGRPFTMLKFRTMRINADHSIHQQFITGFIKSGAGNGQAGSAPFKLAHDPRVTSIGRILRKTSLDELPQFWNVLVGEMSLVGPRPPIPYEVEQYKRWHNRRLFEAKPGVTGLWQVTGRSRTTFDDMVRLDLQYVRSCSLWTDLKILLATPAAVITGKGAC